MYIFRTCMERIGLSVFDQVRVLCCDWLVKGYKSSGVDSDLIELWVAATQ